MFLPESVYIDSDFCYIPTNQMSYSHTWRNAPRRGLAVLNEDSKEEESDRDYVEPKKKKNKEEKPSRISELKRRIPRKVGLLILFSVVLILVILYCHRYHSHFLPSIWKQPSPPLEKTIVQFPNPKTPENGLICDNYTLLKQEEGGGYSYSLETRIPVSFSPSAEIFGFYTAFSETGKQVGSSKYVEIIANAGNYLIWRANQTGHLDSDQRIDHYILTIFIEKETISKVSYRVHCPEKNIRKIVEAREKEGRRELDDRIIQLLLYILSFVIGLFVSKWLAIQ